MSPAAVVYAAQVQGPEFNSGTQGVKSPMLH